MGSFLEKGFDFASAAKERMVAWVTVKFGERNPFTVAWFFYGKKMEGLEGYLIQRRSPSPGCAAARDPTPAPAPALAPARDTKGSRRRPAAATQRHSQGPAGGPRHQESSAARDLAPAPARDTKGSRRRSTAATLTRSRRRPTTPRELPPPPLSAGSPPRRGSLPLCPHFVKLPCPAPKPPAMARAVLVFKFNVPPTP
ncbi:hypothetical protein CK203_021571 [Vitis vinifera]|uniref:Uncharacterized protein n=1 Tax=Vitis vinifera TaxID=29760 RepID=A0A438ISN4_VITVI|nr:hypothetical protein CK203_021571 [Vitis vinifera]